MVGFLVRRVAILAVTLLISSFVVFSALSLSPGNPLSTLSGGRSLPPESVAVLEERYHLDEPFLQRYWSWLTGIVQGDLGVSISERTNVSDLISSRIGTTAGLVLYASALIVIFGIGAGVLAALRPGIVDAGVIVLTAIAAAVPSFVAAILLISVFAVGLDLFPTLGDGSGFWNGLWHLTLPAIALATSAMALVTRITRSSLREELRREHVQTAISRGIPYTAVVRRHGLRNAAIPIVTVTGLTTASLLGLSAVVERAFGLNGLGAYLVEAALSKDFAVVQGITLVLVVAFSVVNTAVDVLYAALDPRVRLGTAAA